MKPTTLLTEMKCRYNSISQHAPYSQLVLPENPETPNPKPLLGSAFGLSKENDSWDLVSRLLRGITRVTIFVFGATY